MTDSVTVSVGTGETTHVQISRVNDSNEILALHESTANAASLWRQVEETVRGLPRSPKEREDAHVIHEYEDARLWLVVNLPQRTAGPVMWEGDAARAPAAVLKIVRAVEALATSQPAVAAAPGTYLRALTLPPQAARDLRRDSVEESALHQSPILQNSIAQPYRFLPVPEAVNPFSPLQPRFVPGRSTLEVSLGTYVVQIRSFTFTALTP